MSETGACKNYPAIVSYYDQYFVGPSVSRLKRISTLYRK